MSRIATLFAGVLLTFVIVFVVGIATNVAGQSLAAKNDNITSIPTASDSPICLALRRIPNSCGWRSATCSTMRSRQARHRGQLRCAGKLPDENSPCRSKIMVVGYRKMRSPHVFERFYRVDPARSRQQSGAGLGLALVQAIAPENGGRVEVQSKPGEGSTFTIYLPIKNTI